MVSWVQIPPVPPIIMENKMLVKFVNRMQGRLGDPIYINVNKILSVYEEATKNGSLSTVIYAEEDKFWFVEEGLSEAVKKINEAFSKYNENK